MAISATVMIFSFSANDAQESSAQSKVIANKVVDIIEQATDKTIGELSGKNDILMRGKVRGVIRKIAHFLEYAFQAIIVFTALFFFRHKKMYLNTVGIGLVTASADELIQTFSIGRAGLLGDVFLDFSGTLTGILIGVFVLKLIRKLYIL